MGNQQSFYSRIFDWNYARLSYELDRYHQLEHTIKLLSGYSLESLKQLLARGYTLEPPNYDATTLVEALELMEREKGEPVYENLPDHR